MLLLLRDVLRRRRRRNVPFGEQRVKVDIGVEDICRTWTGKTRRNVELQPVKQLLNLGIDFVCWRSLGFHRRSRRRRVRLLR